MKSKIKLVLLFVVLAAVAFACTDILLRFSTTAVTVTTAVVGEQLEITIPVETTGYDGSNGNGPVSFPLIASGTFSVRGVTLDVQFGSSSSGTLKILGVPTVAGTQTGTFTLRFFCGSFAGGSISINYSITATAATPTIPTTFYQNFLSGPVQHPISTSTGELFGFDETADLTLRGPLPFEFRRYYASYLKANNVTSALGQNWMHNFDVKLASTPTSATVTLFRGKTVAFTKSGTAFTLSSLERRPYQLVTAGTGFQFLDPVASLIYTFDSAGALTKVEDRNGNAHTVTQAPGGVGPATVTDGLGRTLTFTYTGANLTRVQDHSGRSVNFEQTAGNLVTFVNAAGKRTTFAYTAVAPLAGLLTAETLPLGNKRFTQTFDSQGRVASQTDALSNTTTLNYAANGNGATVNEPRGLTFTNVHDARRNLTSVSDPSGGSAAYTYDANGRPTALTDRLGRRTSATYDPASGLPATLTDAAGGVTTYRYVSALQGAFTFHDLQSVRFPDATTVSFTRDNKGNPLTYTDQNGNVFEATYNSRGQRLTLSTPNGTAATASAAKGERAIPVRFEQRNFDAAGVLTVISSEQIGVLRFDPDILSRIPKVTFPDQTTQQAEFDVLDNVTKYTDELGNSITRTFDDNNNLRRLVDPLDASKVATYNPMDLLSGLANELGKNTTVGFDVRLLPSLITDPTGVVTNYGFNTFNQLATLRNGNNQGFTFVSDRESQLTSSANAVGGATIFAYNPRGEISQTTAPNGAVTKFFFDPLGRQSRLQDALGSDTTYLRNPAGSVTQVTLPGNLNLNFDLNELGDVTKYTDPNRNQWLINRDAGSFPIVFVDPLNRSTGIEYDMRRQIKKIHRADDSTVEFERDAASNPIRLRIGGFVRTFGFDKRNRCVRADGYTATFDAAGNLTESNGIQNLFDDAGRLRTTTFEPGKQVVYTYNTTTGSLATITPWTGGPIVLNYNAANWLTGTTFPNGIAETYTHDPNGNRTGIDVKRGTTNLYVETATRDFLGRVINQTISVGPVANPAPGVVFFNFDPANQIIGNDYDGRGQLREDAFLKYSHDPAGDVTGYSGPTGVASFTYNAFRQPISRTSNGTTHDFLRNCAIPGCPIQISKVGSAAQRFDLYHPVTGELVLSIDGSTNAPTYLHFDVFDNTRGLSNAAGQVTDWYSMTPGGDQIFHTGPSTQPFTLGGRFGVKQQGDAGLFLTGAGFYNAVTGSPLQPRDPFDLTDAWGSKFLRQTPTSSSYDDLRNFLIGTFDSSPPPFLVDTRHLFRSAPLDEVADASTNSANLWRNIENQFVSRTDPTATPFLYVGDDRPHRVISREGHRYLTRVGCPAAANSRFPFVTNQAGFDTGFIVNQATQVPFGIRGGAASQASLFDIRCGEDAYDSANAFRNPITGVLVPSRLPQVSGFGVFGSQSTIPIRDPFCDASRQNIAKLTTQVQLDEAAVTAYLNATAGNFCSFSDATSAVRPQR